MATEQVDDKFSSAGLNRIAIHLREIGIPVRAATLGDDDQLPGVRIERGALLVDQHRLLYPGDVVHEAGHIAVLPPRERARVVGILPSDPGQEMAALAWSYGFAVTFDLPLAVVFHDAFKAGGPWLREIFSMGGEVGVPLLQHWNMSRMSNAPDGFDDLPIFPEMAKWLRDDQQA